MRRSPPSTHWTPRRVPRGRGVIPRPRSRRGTMMHSLTSYDLWKTTPPDDDGEAWEQYEGWYLAAATRIVIDTLTEQLPRSLTPSVYSATVGQVQRLVDGLDAETCLAWANKIGPEVVPTFEA